jgi:hypothetical protein
MERSDNHSELGTSGSMEQDSVRAERREEHELSGDRELIARPVRADAPPNGIERRRADRRRIERLSTDL